MDIGRISIEQINCRGHPSYSFPVLSTNGLWILHHKTLRSAWDVSVEEFWRVRDSCGLPKVVSLARNRPDFPMNTLFS